MFGLLVRCASRGAKRTLLTPSFLVNRSQNLVASPSRPQDDKSLFCSRGSTKEGADTQWQLARRGACGCALDGEHLNSSGWLRKQSEDWDWRRIGWSGCGMVLAIVIRECGRKRSGGGHGQDRTSSRGDYDAVLSASLSPIVSGDSIEVLQRETSNSVLPRMPLL